ncbi:DUF6397 family protein [Streptomyces sp. NPDC052676]|uniref:DUF6397 family protein n=1 Tax=Streptomyces sp. NPDC052676 TaxID=3154953 RepID=UPI003414B344
MSGSTITSPDHLTWTPGRAARELGLKRTEFDLAVNLGRVRTVPDEGGGGRRIPRAEVDRLRSAEGFPEALLDSLRTVGTREAAALVGVTETRFTRFARLGLVTPVRFFVNRYRAVVWLYLAEELRQFAADEKNAPLMKGRMPAGLREQLDAGLDLRPRNWRGRHLGFLLRRAEDPWERAGAVAALLDPVQIADLVKDPYERAHLNRFRPGPPAQSVPGSPAAQLAARIATADGPDEIAWLRAELTRSLEEAREHRPAPRPAQRRQRDLELQPRRAQQPHRELQPHGELQPQPELQPRLERHPDPGRRRGPGRQREAGRQRRQPGRRSHGLLGWLRGRSS